jgi:hypothetical protein
LKLSVSLFGFLNKTYSFVDLISKAIGSVVKTQKQKKKGALFLIEA